MNYSTSNNNAANLTQVIQQEEDNINLLDLLDVVIEQRWTIGVVTALAIAIGAGYAATSTPI